MTQSSTPTSQIGGQTLAESARSQLTCAGKTYDFIRLSSIEEHPGQLARLPYSLRIILEGLLRRCDGARVTEDEVYRVLRWQPNDSQRGDVPFYPERVLFQDPNILSAIAHLAVMREAMVAYGKDPTVVNPQIPLELVIDHAVQVDHAGDPFALRKNIELEYQRNRERYSVVKWAQRFLNGFKVVRPNVGIIHQVNLERLARVIMRSPDGSLVFPDTLLATDSHTTMINGLGVVGWGVGSIEVETAGLGQPVIILIPDVVGVRLSGATRPGVTPTDVVLTITEMLRKRGVVGKFVEFFGSGLGSLSLPDRATIANMAPEYGATLSYFPIDDETFRYLRLTNRPVEDVQIAESYYREQGLVHNLGVEPQYSDVINLDLSSVEPSVAGPLRPQDRVSLTNVPTSFHTVLPRLGKPNGAETKLASIQGASYYISDGFVAIAAITSCTNTSNPSVMIGAGLLARNAVRKGLRVKPWVKTSLSPGSQVVEQYLGSAKLLKYLEALKFHVVGYGCMTCIGNSGPLSPEVEALITNQGLVGCSVLSGNRNFQGRVHPLTRANYLMSPPLVVAYALAGRIDIDWETEPIGLDKKGAPVYLSDIWPSDKEIQDLVAAHVTRAQFGAVYQDVFGTDADWDAVPEDTSPTFPWDPNSTYLRRPPFMDGVTPQVPPIPSDIVGARALVVLGDSVTTDHISPAGSIPVSSPAGQWLIQHGVAPEWFNSYMSRRGNHEVMVRGTFANGYLANQLVPGTEGWFTKHLPSDTEMTIFDAALRYQREGTPVVGIAGKEYGTGSSRDWAAKGASLLRIQFTLTESYERIHRSNLVAMGVLPLEFLPGQSRQSLGLTGTETFSTRGLSGVLQGPFVIGSQLTISAARDDGTTVEFPAVVRLDTAREREYFIHGGVLRYVLRQFLNQ